MTTITVPASQGRAVRVAKGQKLRITTPKGAQAADFFAFNAENVGEWLSCPHTWVTSFCIKPREGDVFLSRFRRPMLRFVKDGANGVHDMMIAACDQFRYEFFGHHHPHASCSDNLQSAMRREGYEVSVIPQPVNFFTNTQIDAQSRLVSPPNPVAPGAFVEMEALMDVICVISSCPFDLPVEGWPINSAQGVTELLLDVQ
ncbi:urea carboxylase-associated family protein [Dongia soli]|uniref:Urea carboxylase-associated family protein n=1 Tax=Dongia soli TaxID=600628 RepID=A0ABU5E9U9_9PROT|nr:urea carboxylase-associated family protein [Dongia soli]MDY0882682.1 urea carboxylase-associated family protein [Dongia soli]